MAELIAATGFVTDFRRHLLTFDRIALKRQFPRTDLDDLQPELDLEFLQERGVVFRTTWSVEAFIDAAKTNLNADAWEYDRVQDALADMASLEKLRDPANDPHIDALTQIRVPELRRRIFA